MINEPTPELEDVSDEEWQTARRWLPLLRALAHKQDRTRAEVAAVAAEMGRGVTQAYTLLRRYEADPKLTSLLPRQKGPAGRLREAFAQPGTVDRRGDRGCISNSPASPTQ